MAEPVSFPSSTNRFALPLLLQGQSQKEFFVNDAHARIDALLHTSVEGMADAPGPAPNEGECWLVSQSPSGDWTGNEGRLAIFYGASWNFVNPQSGMEVFDKSTGQRRIFLGSWVNATDPGAPQGGAIVDIEARSAINGLIEALRQSGILPQTSP